MSEIATLIRAWREAHEQAKEFGILAADKSLSWSAAHEWQKKARNARARARRLRERLRRLGIERPWLYRPKTASQFLHEVRA